MEKTLAILLSGTLGVLIATLLSVWYQHFSEQIRSRKDTMRAVMEWTDNIYLRLQAMQVDKERVCTGKSRSLSEEQYRSMSDEVRILLLSNRIATEVVCVYGEGDILQKINALQGELTKAARILWAAKEASWSDSSKEIMKIFQEKIDPIIASVMGDSLKSTGKVSILRREQMTSRIKKIIAREGLIILSFVGISLLIILTPDLYIKPKPIDLLAGVTSAEDKSIDTLMQFRNKYSQYNDLDNLTLAEKLASKYPEYEQVYKDFQKINERNKNKTNIFDVSTAKPDKRDYYAEEIEGKSSPQYQGTYRLSEVEKAEQQKEKVKTFGFNFFIFGYLAYLLVRFIFWAIRTLKQKDVR